MRIVVLVGRRVASCRQHRSNTRRGHMRRWGSGSRSRRTAQITTYSRPECPRKLTRYTSMNIVYDRQVRDACSGAARAHALRRCGGSHALAQRSKGVMPFMRRRRAGPRRARQATPAHFNSGPAVDNAGETRATVVHGARRALLTAKKRMCALSQAEKTGRGTGLSGSLAGRASCAGDAARRLCTGAGCLRRPGVRA